MGLAWYATRFNHHVSFVGKLGLARCRLKGSRENPPTAELFLFPTATDLRTSETRMYHNGIYSGTTYNYSWSTPGGANVFTLKGQYRSQEGTPPTTNEYWLAKAGEIAWCEYLFDKTAEELEAKGFIQFPLTKQDFVRVGPGFLEFGMKGEVARVTPDQIASLNLSNGQFSIKAHDAGWFGSKGKFSFSYGSMANARLFLFALDRLFGYQV